MLTRFLAVLVSAALSLAASAALAVTWAATPDDVFGGPILGEVMGEVDARAAEAGAVTSAAECRGCHAAQCDALAASAHRALGCLDCHGAHGEGAGVPARERCPEACYRCHAEFRDPDHFHTHDGSVTDPIAARPLTCTSTCHDAHGSANTHMLTVPYEVEGHGSDEICRTCHSGVGISY